MDFVFKCRPGHVNEVPRKIEITKVPVSPSGVEKFDQSVVIETITQGEGQSLRDFKKAAWEKLEEIKSRS